MQPRNVLVPLDGSRLAERSLAFLPALAQFGSLSVTLLSVIDENEDIKMLSQPEVLDRERNVLQTYLREVASDLHKHLNLQVETEVLEGSPAELILSRCGVSRPDLLLVSTHGRSGIARWRVGSVADKLIRGAGCQTLVIGPHASDEEGWLASGAQAPFKHIMVPLDGSELGESALETAQTFASQFESEVHLVRAINLQSYSDGLVLESSFTPRLIDTVTDDAKAYLDKAVTRVKAPAGTRTMVLLGSAATALEEYIDKNAIDLVVMSTHGRGGVARAALGSVTDRLMGGPAPVLVVRPPIS
jgi:nucleotide-binding universal stress UspA family protein